MARPKVVVDWKKVDRLLKAGLSGTVIADTIGVKVDTLYKRCIRDKKMLFSEYQQQKRQVGLETLKLKQYDLAVKGDKSMLVWLGKQYLNQSEKGEVKIVEKDTFTENYDLRKLNAEELKELKELLERAKKGETE